jgi:hypothetical protein
VVFLNPHNTGGTVVCDVLLRYGQTHNLSVVLPSQTRYEFRNYTKDNWNNVDAS